MPKKPKAIIFNGHGVGQGEKIGLGLAILTLPRYTPCLSLPRSPQFSIRIVSYFSRDDRNNTKLSTEA